jgi:hypothetical protein
MIDTTGLPWFAGAANTRELSARPGGSSGGDHGGNSHDDREVNGSTLGMSLWRMV